MQSLPAQSSAVLCVAFNQDTSCFVAGTTNGFDVYSIDPIKHIRHRDLATGIALVQMLHRSSLFALVGNGTSAAFPTTKVFIWDDSQSRSIGELGFRSPVRCIRLRRDHLITAISRKVYVHRLTDLAFEYKFETYPNSRGLLGISYNLPSPGSFCSLAFCSLGPQQGSVAVHRFRINSSPSSPLRQQKRLEEMVPVQPVVIQAHTSQVAALVMSSNGAFVATASARGTLVRVFDAETGASLQEFRRGTDKAFIYSIAFSYKCTILAITSDKGTAHIFRLNTALRPRTFTDDMGLRIVGTHSETQEVGPLSPQQQQKSRDDSVSTTKSTFQLFGGLVPLQVSDYLESERSFAQIRELCGIAVCAFTGTSDTLAVVCTDGTFRHCSFDGDATGGLATCNILATYMRVDTVTLVDASSDDLAADTA